MTQNKVFVPRFPFPSKCHRIQNSEKKFPSGIVRYLLGWNIWCARAPTRSLHFNGCVLFLESVSAHQCEHLRYAIFPSWNRILPRIYASFSHLLVMFSSMRTNCPNSNNLTDDEIKPIWNACGKQIDSIIQKWLTIFKQLTAKDAFDENLVCFFCSLSNLYFFFLRNILWWLSGSSNSLAHWDGILITNSTYKYLTESTQNTVVKAVMSVCNDIMTILMMRKCISNN